MDENTRIKKLQMEIASMTATMQKLSDDAERRHSEYLHHRNTDLGRLEHVEAHMGTLKHDSTVSGGSNSITIYKPFQVRNVKLYFPCFDGSDVLHWIFKAEYSIVCCYCKLQGNS